MNTLYVVWNIPAFNTEEKSEKNTYVQAWNDPIIFTVLAILYVK